MSFRISSLPKSSFEHLFAMRDEDLARNGAICQIVNKKPGFPCRVSLEDAEIGEEVLLVHYEHQNVPTPFRASHAVYVRRNAIQAAPELDEVPGLLRSRTLSVRGFDSDGMMVYADLSDGRNLEAGIENAFCEANVAYLHLHFAGPGCYAARVDRGRVPSS